MKKITIIMSVMALALILGACTRKSETGDSNEIKVVGTWEQNNSDKDTYFVLELSEDGSGKLITKPDDIGCPLDYEITDNTIMTHLGSIDDNTPMEYNKDTDQIIYDDICFSRVK